MLKSIIFVDDDIQILKAIKRVLIETEYELFFSESAEDALEIMSKNLIDMVVTDVRMPGMDGIELLQRIKKEYPDTIRMILSGFADEQEVMLTLQNNLAKAYMRKPWNNDELVRVIEQNLGNSKAHLPHEIISFINNMDKIPTLNDRYQNIQKAIREENDIEFIAKEIEKDPAIAAKILQLANSAYYGIKTGSLKKALSIIGINELQSLLLSIEIINCLPVAEANCSIAEKIWNHAYYTSKLQNIIQMKFLGKQGTNLNATAGLLHKIGIVFMIMFYADDYVALLKDSMENKDYFLRERELQKYGFTHSEISAYLLRSWNVPEQIIEIAEFYDSPLNDAVRDKDLACIIHIAQHYACEHLNMEPFCLDLNEAFDHLGIDRTFFEEQYTQML